MQIIQRWGSQQRTTTSQKCAAYLRLIEFVYQSTLGSRVIKKEKKGVSPNSFAETDWSNTRMPLKGLPALSTDGNPVHVQQVRDKCEEPTEGSTSARIPLNDLPALSTGGDPVHVQQVRDAPGKALHPRRLRTRCVFRSFRF